jgi:uncharacterized DUF497 family protein
VKPIYHVIEASAAGNASLVRHHPKRGAAAEMGVGRGGDWPAAQCLAIEFLSGSVVGCVIGIDLQEINLSIPAAQYAHAIALYACYNSSMITWDESKRQSNLRDHHLDFVGCDAVFDAPVFTWNDDREAYGELRINLLGWLNGVVVHMTYTERGDDLHVISLRKAEKHEIRHYIAAISH